MSHNIKQPSSEQHQEQFGFLYNQINQVSCTPLEGTKMEEKEKALKMAIAAIEKKFGKGAIIKLGDRPNLDIEVIPTGCLELDIALGIGEYQEAE